MERSKTIALGLLCVVGIAIAVLVTRATPPRQAPTVASGSARPAASAAPVPSLAPAASAGLAALDELGETTAGGFDLLPDGKKAPPLPDSAPQTVSFGVVVYTYTGAELAPPGARSKDQARERAASAIQDAKHDFAAAVARGDRGSTANAGRMPRGVLESAAEYVLFTLPKGEVAPAPVDTPRGFWVLRRID